MSPAPMPPPLLPLASQSGPISTDPCRLHGHGPAGQPLAAQYAERMRQLLASEIRQRRRHMTAARALKDDALRQLVAGLRTHHPRGTCRR